MMYETGEEYDVPNECTPILLFGLPRSGTTWVAKIFDSHPQTLYRHELERDRPLDLPFVLPIEQAQPFQELIREYVSQAPRTFSTRSCTVLPVLTKQYYAPLQFQVWRAVLLLSKAAARTFGDFEIPRWLSPRVLGDLPPRLVWKSVASVGRLGAIASALPGCYGVLIVRNPCGFVASKRRGEASGKFESGREAGEKYHQFRELLENSERPGHWPTMAELARCHPVEKLAWRWVLLNEFAMRAIDQWPRCMTVRYEDFCNAPIAYTKSVFRFTALPWSQQTERFIRRTITKSSDDYYSLYRDPVQAANNWRRQLSVEDIQRVARVVRDSRPGQLYAADFENVCVT